MIAEERLRADLVNYLTGSMPEEARALFEEKLLTSQSFSDAVAHLEQELVDDYATGNLPGEETSALRPWVESSTRRMQRVEMARTLFKKRMPASRRFALWGAIAACLIAMVTTVMLQRHETPAREQQAQSLPPQAAGAPASGHRELSPQVLLLVAERVRGVPPVATYHVSPETPVELQILLAGEAAQGNYSLSITSPRTHLEVNHLHPQVQAQHVYLETVFPSGALPPDTYTAVVGGAGGTLVAHFVIAR